MVLNEKISAKEHSGKNKIVAFLVDTLIVHHTHGTNVSLFLLFESFL